MTPSPSTGHESLLIGLMRMELKPLVYYGPYSNQILIQLNICGRITEFKHRSQIIKPGNIFGKIGVHLSTLFQYSLCWLFLSFRLTTTHKMTFSSLHMLTTWSLHSALCSMSHRPLFKNYRHTSVGDWRKLTTCT